MHTYTYHPNSTGSIKILQHYTYFPFFSNSKEDFIMYLFLLLHWVLGVECEIFLLHRGMRDLPWQGMQPGSPALGPQSLNEVTRPPRKPLRFYYLKSGRFREESRGLDFGVGQRSRSFLFCFCCCLVTKLCAALLRLHGP